MDSYIRWFHRLIWLGILMNMMFAIPAMFSPGLLTSLVGLPPQFADVWLENAGMLLVGIRCFTCRRPSTRRATRSMPGWAC